MVLVPYGFVPFRGLAGNTIDVLFGPALNIAFIPKIPGPIVSVKSLSA